MEQGARVVVAHRLGVPEEGERLDPLAGSRASVDTGAAINKKDLALYASGPPIHAGGGKMWMMSPPGSEDCPGLSGAFGRWATTDRSRTRLCHEKLGDNFGELTGVVFRDGYDGALRFVFLPMRVKPPEILPSRIVQSRLT